MPAPSCSGGLRQPDAHHRPLPRMLRRRPLRPSLGAAADRFALGVDDQQGADRHLGEGLRRGFRFRPRARQGRLPARRHHAVHRQRARRAGGDARAAAAHPAAPLVMGVDIARQGDDQTVIRFRRGLDARSIPAVKFRIPDLMAGGRPGHGAGQQPQSRCRVRRRHRHRLGRRRSPDPARLLDRARHRFRRPGRPHRRRRRRGALRQQARRDVGLHEGMVQGGLPARRPRARRPTSPRSITATTPRTPSCSSARTTCGSAASPRRTTATRWRSPSPIRSAKRDWAEERRFEEGLARLRRRVV